MALKQASRFLLVLVTAWSLCGFAALLNVDQLNQPSRILVTNAYAGDPDEFSDGTEKPPADPADTSESDGLIDQILNWIEDTVKDIFN